jgi:hypothetical protein
MIAMFTPGQCIASPFENGPLVRVIKKSRVFFRTLKRAWQQALNQGTAAGNIKK